MRISPNSIRPIRSVRDEYVAAYRGLPRRAWILFAVNLVNSSGSMVFFFLSLYLTRKMGLSAARAGQVLSLYGFGSLAGAFLGGWLSDKIGSIRVQILSLWACGTFLIVLGQVTAVAPFIPVLFGFGLSAGMLFPANATSMAEACPPELQVKGFALTRLANNLGATIGPAVGGVLALHNYRLLFWVDGLTSLAAAALFGLLWTGTTAGAAAAGRTRTSGSPTPGAGPILDGSAGSAAMFEGGGVGAGSGPDAGAKMSTDAKVVRGQAPVDVRPVLSPWRDAPFLLMMLIFLVWSIVFVQVLTTFPLYIRNVYGLAENRIGQLYAVNTILIVMFEMVLMEKIRKYPLALMINVSFVMLGLGLGLMPFGRSFAFGALTVAVWTFGEMLSMPLVSALIARRSNESNRGRYMGLSSLSFSLAFIVAPAVGMAIYGRFGGDAVWFICSGVSLLLAVAFSALRPYLDGVGPQQVKRRSAS